MDFQATFVGLRLAFLCPRCFPFPYASSTRLAVSLHLLLRPCAGFVPDRFAGGFVLNLSKGASGGFLAVIFYRVQRFPKVPPSPSVGLANSASFSPYSTNDSYPRPQRDPRLRAANHVVLIWRLISRSVHDFVRYHFKLGLPFLFSLSRFASGFCCPVQGIQPHRQPFFRTDFSIQLISNA